MQYLEKLKALKEEKKLTNAEIAKVSNIPLATITRIFNGSTPNPTFETISHIAVALGTSLDELVGLKHPDEPSVPAHIETTITSYVELLKEKDDRINELKNERIQEHKEKVILAIALASIIAFIFLLLTIDVANGHFGYFRY